MPFFAVSANNVVIFISRTTQTACVKLFNPGKIISKEYKQYTIYSMYSYSYPRTPSRTRVSVNAALGFVSTKRRVPQRVVKL